MGASPPLHCSVQNRSSNLLQHTPSPMIFYCFWLTILAGEGASHLVINPHTIDPIYDNVNCHICQVQLYMQGVSVRWVWSHHKLGLGQHFISHLVSHVSTLTGGHGDRIARSTESLCHQAFSSACICPFTICVTVWVTTRNTEGLEEEGQ